MKKRYCIFVANYLPNLGGVERYTLNLSKHLYKRGIDVTIVTSNVFGLPALETIDGIEIFRVPCLNLLNGRFPVLKASLKTRESVEQLNQRRFDFIIVQTRFYLHSLFGVRYAKKRKIPCIVIEHGTAHFTVNNRLWDWVGHIYEHAETALVKHYCDDFYGVSEECCDWLQHFHIRPKGVLYNAVDLKDISAKLNLKIEDYHKYNIERDAVIVYAGRLVKEKGIIKLIEAVKQCVTMGYKLSLMIAGDGDMLEVIQNMNLEYVNILGKVDFEHVVALYGSSDIFCLPTDYPEGFPTSVLEAAACKCYIITTMNGGSKELIIDDTYGAILKENSSENIAKAIIRVIEDPKYKLSAEQRTYERLCKYFTWDKVCERIINMEGEINHD